MAEGASLTFEIDVPLAALIEGVEPLAIPRFHTRASKSNREFVEGRLQVDPRTSTRSASNSSSTPRPPADS